MYVSMIPLSGVTGAESQLSHTQACGCGLLLDFCHCCGPLTQQGRTYTSYTLANMIAAWSQGTAADASPCVMRCRLRCGWC